MFNKVDHNTACGNAEKSEVCYCPAHVHSSNVLHLQVSEAVDRF